MAPNSLPMLGFEDLTAFQNNAAGNNLMLNLSPLLGSAKFDMRTWSPEQQLGTSAAQGFLSAILGGLGRQQVADQTRSVAALLPALYANPSSVAAPEGVDQSAFEALKGAAQLRNLQRTEIQKQTIAELFNDLFKAGIQKKVEAIADAQLSGDPIRKADAAAMIAEMTGNPAPERRVTPYEKAVETLGSKAVAEDAIKGDMDATRKASESIAKVDGALDFVRKQFDDAKEFGSLSAAVPGTDAANALAGIQTNLRTKLQQMIGREMNGPEQERLMAALPDWNDTKAQIEAKKGRFLDLVRSVSNPATPTALATKPDQFTNVARPAVNGITQADAIAELRRRGVTGF